MNKICIVGLGYVGMTLAMHAARNNYKVYGVEVLDSTYQLIKQGKTHFHEPGLEELLKISLNKNFFVSKEIDPSIDYDVIIITVGTPLSNETQNMPNMDVLYGAINSIKNFIKEDTLLILRSTIPVGTSREMASLICSNNNLEKINISFCPERTAEGKALDELRSLPQIISGINPKASLMARSFFEPLVDEIIETSSLEEAELTKLFNNTYRDSIFAIANSFNMIAQSFGVDGVSVIQNANKNYHRSAIPLPGFVAGPCLEKDAYILSSNMQESHLKDFLYSIRYANESIENSVAIKINDIILHNPSAKILLSGMAFKGIPQTNDLRGSSSLKILDKLTNSKDQITIHDFMNEQHELEKVTSFSAINSNDFSLESGLEFDYIFILNNHPGYKNISSQSFVKNLISSGSCIVDTWNVMQLDNQFTISNLFINNGK